MAKGGLNLGLVVVIVASATLIARTSAQSGCTMTIIGLAPCLNYITGSSSTPASSCCSQLASVVQSNPSCLCSLLNGGGSSFGINVNQTLALALPVACNVQTPPVSQCNAAPATTPPAESPNATPDDSRSTPSVPGNPTPTSTATPNAPSGNGSKTVPGRSGQSADGSSNVFSLSALLLLLSIAAFPSFY
ncbi:hypothetical protein QJS04_geneDACA021143 [Acorus gramineus]|uniref:Bifunctional inhibitor/plant lipid transfer protein/seed storage helical domain-containing protein n=1 Tax=Acorus gramineus TaxID=55184 RepID=A0AAV9AEQ7_ACOGR|nr:hypothetical protein QJS04_geneDACA021143 [Acorus gramineus]